MNVTIGRLQQARIRELAARKEGGGVHVDAGRGEQALLEYADTRKLDLVLTTGGTGFGPRDNTPEATRGLLDRGAPGIEEALRAHGQLRTARSMLSRGAAGLRGKTLIINLPGSPKAVAEYLDCLLPPLKRCFSERVAGADC